MFEEICGPPAWTCSCWKIQMCFPILFDFDPLSEGKPLTNFPKTLSRKRVVHYGGNISSFPIFVCFSAVVKLWNICQDVASAIPWSLGASIFTTEGAELLADPRPVEDWVCVSFLERFFFNPRNLHNTKTQDLCFFTLQMRNVQDLQTSHLAVCAWPVGHGRSHLSLARTAPRRRGSVGAKPSERRGEDLKSSWVELDRRFSHMGI